MSEQFVVVSRYVAPSGRAVVHAYGTYATRRRAEAARTAMLRDVADVVIEVSVCKVLDPEEVDA